MKDNVCWKRWEENSLSRQTLFGKPSSMFGKKNIQTVSSGRFLGSNRCLGYHRQTIWLLWWSSVVRMSFEAREPSVDSVDEGRLWSKEQIDLLLELERRGSCKLTFFTKWEDQVVKWQWQKQDVSCSESLLITKVYQKLFLSYKRSNEKLVQDSRWGSKKGAPISCTFEFLAWGYSIVCIWDWVVLT